jgi:hypothetical protein
VNVKTPAASQEELVREIARELRPWKVPESHVFAHIRPLIGTMRDEFSKAPVLGFRSETKRYTEDLLATLKVLKKQLASAPSGFFWNLCALESIALHKQEDIIIEALRRRTANYRFSPAHPKHKSQQELYALLGQVDELIKQCENVILNPIGYDPREGYKQSFAVDVSVILANLSTKKPTADRLNVIASLLWEAATGCADAISNVPASTRSISNVTARICRASGRIRPENPQDLSWRISAQAVCPIPQLTGIFQWVWAWSRQSFAVHKSNVSRA